MRLMTWNCAGGFLDKVQHVAAFRPDLAAIQECTDVWYPAVRDVVAARLGWDGGRDKKELIRKRGVGLYSCTGLTATPYERWDDTLHYALPMRVDAPQPFNVIAVWVKKTEEGKPPHGDRISDYVYMLERMLDSYRQFMVERDTVVIGDFNTSAFYEAQERNNRLTHNSIVAELGARGLVSAYHAARQRTVHGDEPEMTHRNSGGPKHIDYCFIPQQWSERLGQVAVEWLACKSDHAALIVDITE